MGSLIEQVIGGPPAFDAERLRALDPEAFCREVLPHVSRTFALSVPVLPEPARLRVTVAYLLCRMADTVEDSPIEKTEDRSRAFNALLRAVGNPVSGALLRDFAGRLSAAPACKMLFERGADVLAVFRSMAPGARSSIARCVIEMIDGMRRTPPPSASYRFDAVSSADGKSGDRPAESRGPVARMFNTVEELEGYCHYVAGVVGLMLLELFEDALPPGTSTRDLRPQAHRFGLGLQLVNIFVDQYADAEAGRVFLPEDGASAMPGGALLNRAREHLDAALEFTLALPTKPPGYRMFCLLPLFFALRTLRAFETQRDSRRPRMSRADVREVAQRAAELAGDDAGLRAWFAQERIAAAPPDSGAAG